MSVICNEHWHDLRDVLLKNFKKDSEGKKNSLASQVTRWLPVVFILKKNKKFFDRKSEEKRLNRLNMQ